MTNYTISKFKAVETIGDSIMFNNMITHGTLLITPNPNYVVTASDFSIGSLPSDIKSVVFADTTTAGQLGNTVTVTAAFVTTFVVTGDINLLIRLAISSSSSSSRKANIPNNQSMAHLPPKPKNVRLE